MRQILRFKPTIAASFLELCDFILGLCVALSDCYQLDWKHVMEIIMLREPIRIHPLNIKNIGIIS